MRITRPALRIAGLVAFAALFAAVILERPLAVHAQVQPGTPGAAETIKARYTKHEFQIPMRDGVKLFTSVYVPKDTDKPYPILLQRTPYSVGPYGPDAYRRNLGPSDLFLNDGYIVAYQDVRGRFMSEGEWVEMRPQKDVKHGSSDIDESSDTYDTIDWLLKNVPNNNGRVGIWGISYPGFYAAAGIIDAHPALKAASPQAPIGDLFMGDDSYHNGAFMLAANMGFYVGFLPRVGGPSQPPERAEVNFGTPDGYDFYLRLGSLMNSSRYFTPPNPYWNDNLAHTTYDDFWKSRALVPHVKKVTPAVLMVGGWFDAEDLSGPLALFRQIEKTTPGAANTLVMGPWPHGGWARSNGDRLGNLRFDANTSAYFREKIEFPFFAHYLKDAPLEALPKAYVFETGANAWHRYDVWPPAAAQPKAFYFREQGRLLAEAPGAAATAAATAGATAMATANGSASAAFDQYVSDPNHPVPYLGYTAFDMTRDYMTEDQRFAATRPDVLVYETDPLDADVHIAGPIKVDLHVSTSTTDADWVVKVIDVYPGDYPSPAPAAPGVAGAAGPAPSNTVKMGGYQQLVRGEPFRGKFRRSFEKPEPFTPNTPAEITFQMADVAHTFRKGHRMMVQVQSSWFPLVDRNPQTFVEIPKAAPSDYQTATIRVYRSRQLPSSITLLVLSGTAGTK
jgi:putative CocE/NonD family hydrolase